MARNDGWGSGLWKDLQKVRLTDGTLEAPVTADDEGLQVGSVSVRPDGGPAAPRRRRGLLARLLRRR